jgi:Bacterial membrane protein YfhO
VYVGVVALVLAVTALVLRWRRPEVRSFGLVALVMGVLVFVSPLASLLNNSVARIYWVFAIMPLVLAVAVLSGVGMDLLVRYYKEERVRRALGLGFAVMAVVLGITWIADRGGLTPSQVNIRSHSFIWPTIAVITGLAVVWALAKRSTRAWTHRASHSVGAGSVAGLLLLLVETAFLVASGAPLTSSSSHYPTSTPEVTALKRAVGNAVVGFGATPTFALKSGILTNDNLLYDVQEFATYDPMTPHAYFSLAKARGSEVAGAEDIFSPAITSLRAARLYGISYLLEPTGVRAPRGSVFDRTIGNEDLYRVPGAAAATLVTTPPRAPLPGKYAPGTPVNVAHPSPSTWKMVTSATAPSILRLRLTDVPGWQATIDGKPVDVRHFAGVMLQLRVPAGHHVVELRYWPTTFTTGIVLAICSVFGLAVALIVPPIRRRSARGSTKSAEPGALTVGHEEQSG